jgi:hypothetical protein
VRHGKGYTFSSMRLGRTILANVSLKSRLGLADVMQQPGGQPSLACPEFCSKQISRAGNAFQMRIE